MRHEDQHKVEDAALVRQGEADNKTEGCRRGVYCLKEARYVKHSRIHSEELQTGKVVPLRLRRNFHPAGRGNFSQML